MTSALLDRTYELITNDEDEGDICDSIPDEACTDVRSNFFLNAANGSATKLADKLASAELVLPWLLDVLGAPTYLTGLLVPIRRGGALLPQLAVAGQIRQYEKRKWFWVAGGVGQTLALALMALSALFLDAAAAGIAIVVFLAILSLSRGVSSVAFKDVLAKTIPRGRRGTLLALRSTIGGVLTLIAGLMLRAYVVDSESVTPFVVLLFVAVGLWLIGIVLFAAITEPDGATGGARSGIKEAQAGFRLLSQLPDFRRFVIARTLILTIVLSQPFYVLFAREHTGGAAEGLGIFLIALSLAEITSSLFWGRFADRSSRVVMALGSGMAAGTGVLALIVGSVGELGENVLIFGFIFLLLGLARAGARLGRKTYLIDSAPDETRPTLVAMTSTIVGVATFAGSALGVIGELFGLQTLIVILIVLAALGAITSWRLSEASEVERRAAELHAEAEV